MIPVTCLVRSTATLQGAELLIMTMSVGKVWERPVGLSDSSPQSGHFLGEALSLPAQKFDFLIVPEVTGLGNGAHAYMARGVDLLGQNATIPFGLCSLATLEAQMSPGRLGPTARSLGWIMGRQPGTRLWWCLQPPLEEHPGDGWHRSSVDIASLCLWSSAFFTLLSLCKFVTPD